MIYAIGDIHGKHTMLEALLAKLTELPLQREDRIVFLGDYIDRGENARRVLETLLQWQEQYPHTVFLRGNHEQLMLDAYGDGIPPLETAEQSLRAQLALDWLQNGGIDTLLSYDPPGFRDWCETVAYALLRVPAIPLAVFRTSFMRWLEAIPPSHWKFLQTTQMEYITSLYHFVHAGLLTPGQSWESEGWTIDPRLWIREPFLSSRADFNGRIVVFGHTPQRKGRPLIHRNKMGLDTGAVFGGPLTAAVLNLQAHAPCFIQVPHIRHLSLSQEASARITPASPRASSAVSSRK